MALVVGSILGYKGSDTGEWRTCALVVTAGDNPPPQLTWFVGREDQAGTDQNTSDRVHLKRHKVMRSGASIGA